MGKELKMQPTLMHVPTEKDIVYTPPKLAKNIISFFHPSGIILDPCMGDGAFYNLLPAGREWCEIEKGRDFYAWTKPVNWIIGNPPYSNLLAWLRHSFTLAEHVVYLVPMHRVFASAEFLDDMMDWGRIAHIRLYRTGTYWGFPFGHALAAVHYRRDFALHTTWSRY